MRPMLATNAPANLKSLLYPILSSEKLDGIRCIIKNGQALSRTLKPIRNRFIQSILSNPAYEGLDGELIVGDPNAADCMRVTNSGVMSADGEPDFAFWVFDYWNRPGQKYTSVQEKLDQLKTTSHITLLPQRVCHTAADIEAHERHALDDGYEGLILRRPDGLYKFGRSTAREGYLLKLKRYHQAEAVIVGTEPLYKNLNEAEVDNLGYTKRSSAKDGKVELNMLGALIVEGWNPYNPELKTVFNIGSGFTMAERESLWTAQSDLIGLTVTYKYFPTGSKERPRHPVFVSFRDSSDL